MSEPVYRAFAEHIRFHAGGGEEIVIDGLSGRVHALSAIQSRVLAACRGARTLDEHAAEAARRLASAGLRPETARALVETLSFKGLLVDESALRDRIASSVRPARARPSIELLGIPTNGRPSLLAACIRGHAASAKAHGRRVTFVVADGATNADGAIDAAAATLAVLRALAAEGIAVRVAARAERAAYAPLLAARASVDPALVNFALAGDPCFGPDTGANRNALLLDAAGEALLFVDDDVRPRAVPAPAPREGIALVTGDPTESWFADPSDPLVPPDRWQSPDLLALHETLLGADVARTSLDGPLDTSATDQGVARTSLDGPLDTSAAGAPFFRRLSRRGGRVAITQLGAAGDHGMAASFGLLLLAGPSRERLLASEARFTSAFTQRLVLRCVARPTIADGASFMTMTAGVDARDLVPLFAPAGRDSDGLFGALVRACLPDAFSGHVPWAVEHVPPEPRTASFDHERSTAGRAGVNELLRVALAAAFDPRDARSDILLVRAGRTFENLAARPDEAAAFFREHTVRGLARRLAQIERALADHARRPAFWSQTLDAFAVAMRAALADPATALPPDLVASHGLESARALFVAHVARTGRLLAAWPALFESARALRAEGLRLSRPVTPA